MAEAAPKIREGFLMGFIHRNLFRVKLYNGVEIVALMPDELLPSFDPNVQLTKYNRPYVDVEIREPPQLPKIIAIRKGDRVEFHHGSFSNTTFTECCNAISQQQVMS